MSTSSPDQTLQHMCFQEWMQLQEQNLNELSQALTLNPHRAEHLTQLVQRNIQNFEIYVNKRASLARENVANYFAPTWCTSLENSHLWIAGCRPASFIRLVYTLCGFEIESRLTEFMLGERNGDLGELTGAQLSAINELQAKTIHEEEKLSSKLASLQEEVADQPLALIAKKVSKISELTGEARKALEEHAQGMANVLEEADQLRLSTLKELIAVLTPLQAVDFLAAAKKLRLCLHACMGTKVHIPTVCSDVELVRFYVEY